jgi:hypothetical protein
MGVLVVAFKRAKLLDGEPVVRTVERDQQLNLLIVGLTKGRRLLLPVEDLQGLEKVTHRQLKHYELHVWLERSTSLVAAQAVSLPCGHTLSVASQRSAGDEATHSVL